MLRQRSLSLVRIKQCGQCDSDTEYYCHQCQQDLCHTCQEEHVVNWVTRNHEVTRYREKFNNLPKRELCAIHRDRYYNRFCESCGVLVCESCSEHKAQRPSFLSCLSTKAHGKHKLVGINVAYQTKRQQYKGMIHELQSEIDNMSLLVDRLQSDMNVCHKKINRCQSKMVIKGQTLKDFMDSVLLVFNVTEIYKQSLARKQDNMIRYITMIENYEERSEGFHRRPVRFLKFIKAIPLSQIQDTPCLTHTIFSLSPKINMDDLIRLLSDVTVTERRKRYAKKERPVKQTSFHEIGKPSKEEEDVYSWQKTVSVRSGKKRKIWTRLRKK